MQANILAADIHQRMVNDNRFGYSWVERYGFSKETWTIGGHTFEIKVGDYDCSSSSITAWTIAFAAIGVNLVGATFTGNMKNAFLATGLFKWVPVSQAVRGDLYLSEENHVAMCQGNGMLSEFSISETGGTTGKRGDQTGWEAKMNTYYNYPWDGCLHYIGTKEIGSKVVVSSKPINNLLGKKPTVKWRVKQNGKWQKENYVGKRGVKIQDLAISIPGWYQVKTKKSGWLPPVTGYNIKDSENGYAGDGSDILDVRVYLVTPNPPPYYKAKYRVSAVNKGYYDYQHDTETTNGQDGYAGDHKPIDRFQLKVV